MIFDARLRPPTKSFVQSWIYDLDESRPTAAGYGYDASARESSIGLLLEEMDEAGIDAGLVPGRRNSIWGDVPNDEIRELTETYPGRFYGLWGTDADDAGGSVREISAAERVPGMVGIAVEPSLASHGPMASDDKRLFDLYEMADELSYVVSITLSGLAGPDMGWSDPIAVQRVAQRFPRVRFLISHAAWPYTREMVAVAFVCPNVYLTADKYLNTPDWPGAKDYIDAVNVYLADRFLFSTSFPSRPLRRSLDEFGQIGFRDDVAEKVLGGNAAVLFGLEGPTAEVRR